MVLNTVSHIASVLGSKKMSCWENISIKLSTHLVTVFDAVWGGTLELSRTSRYRCRVDRDWGVFLFPSYP